MAMEKAFSLLSEAAEKGCTKGKDYLGNYYFDIENYEEARRWYEAAACRGDNKITFLDWNDER